MASIENIPENCEYPQLREIADSETLARQLQRNMGPPFDSGKLIVDRCKVKRLYYKPGGSCRLHLKAKIRDAEHREIGEQIFFGRLYRPDSVNRALEEARTRRLVQPAFGYPLTLIQPWNMILWAYPNDPNLKGLATLLSPDQVLEQMQRAPDRFGLDSEDVPVGIESTLTKYVPGQRCGYIFDVTLRRNGAKSPAEGYRVYGKAYRDEAGKKAYEIMRQIWTSEARRRGDLVLPQPYSYDDETNILWQEALSGPSLAKMPASVDLPAVAREVGRGLAAFHGAKMDLPTRMTIEYELADLRRSVAAIVDSFPDVAERCRALEGRLTALVSKLGSQRLTPVHGSFKFSHIFLSGNRVAFIDFDGANIGDPTYDLGRFMAHVHKMLAGWKVSPEIAEKTIQSFCSGYNDAAATPIHPERIMWYATSLTVSSQVYKAVKRFDPGLISKLLTKAEESCPGA